MMRQVGTIEGIQLPAKKVSRSLSSAFCTFFCLRVRGSHLIASRRFYYFSCYATDHVMWRARNGGARALQDRLDPNEMLLVGACHIKYCL